jgi:hypothetical protein
MFNNRTDRSVCGWMVESHSRLHACTCTRTRERRLPKGEPGNHSRLIRITPGLIGFSFGSQPGLRKPGGREGRTSNGRLYRRSDTANNNRKVGCSWPVNRGHWQIGLKCEEFGDFDGAVGRTREEGETDG